MPHALKMKTGKAIIVALFIAAVFSVGFTSAKVGTPETVTQGVYNPGEVLLANNVLTLYDDDGWANVVQAAKYLNDMVVQPGGVFSYNDTVGERTVERGFVEGPVVAWNGDQYVMSQDIGGGVCRLSTGVFRGAYDAGIAPLERHSHSLRVNYAAPGWDAAVSWGVWDFKFRNPYPYPIEIVVNLGYREINVKIYGLVSGSGA